MYAYILRKLLYSIPVYLGIILLVMLCLRVNDPASAYLGKSASAEQITAFNQQAGLDRPFFVQYASLIGRVFTLDFSERSWERKQPVGEILASAVLPSLSVALPAMILTTLLAVLTALIAAYLRGSLTDKVLMFAAVLGMSISLLVYVIVGQYFGTYYLRQNYGLDLFAISGYKPLFEPLLWHVPGIGLPIPYPANIAPGNWAYYCLLPVIITVLLSVGYDTRFYRAVMVEECNRDYIVTAKAKGASKPKIMFVHMLKNAMIPIITNVMITLPFLITGSIVIEQYFLIPGMGRTLITAIVGKDFPIVQAFTAVFAGVFILTNILTDVLYALVDPRVRLS